MKSIGVYKAAPVETPGLFTQIETDAPVAEGRDVLIRVKGVAVNPVDFKVRQGKADDGTFKVLGWDGAGVVEAVGKDVTLFRPGDEVWFAGDVTRSGSNTQLQLVDERIVALKPKSLGFADAAALPLTTITAWEALFDRLLIDRMAKEANGNKTVLIIGGAGGVGSIAIQLAKLAGLQVIATASRPETVDWVKKLGADHVINHRNPLPDEMAAINIAAVDYIFCTADTDQYFDMMAELIAPQGRIVTITEAKENHNVDLLKAKSASFSYEFMFTRSMFQTPDMIAQHKLLGTVAQLVDDGVIRNTANESFGPLTPESLQKAHALLESGKAIGKITFEGIPD